LHNMVSNKFPNCMFSHHVLTRAYICPFGKLFNEIWF
jgi:hypothetical protein